MIRLVNHVNRIVLLSMTVWCLTQAVPVLFAAPLAFANDAAMPALSLGVGQSSTSASPIMSTSVRMIGGLFLCLGVFAIVVRLLKRHSSHTGAGRRRIEIRERVALSSKSALTLIAIDNKEFLVASGSESVNILPTHAVPAGLFAESLDEVVDGAEAFNA
jgi:flagellar biogenesis protein FliO